MDNGAQIYHLAEEKMRKTGIATRLPAQDTQQHGPRGEPGIQTQMILEPKEFVWDRCVTLLVAGILSLTSVYLVVQFFRRPSSSVVCYVPSNFTSAQFAYVNSFCSSGLPSAQYYPIFITLQGLFISAPHQVWSWMFRGFTTYFVDLAKTLDRLQSVRTGRHRDANIAIVTKLEKEFSTKGIFYGYLAKLSLQLALVVIAIFVTLAVFDDFAVIFQCSQQPGALYRENDLPLLDTGPITFVCLYASLKLMSILRYLDITLLCIVMVVLLFGIGWCFRGHPNELGAKQLAHYMFYLCLPASQVKFIFDGLFSPRIKDDLDFLLMQLYQADAGYGLVFKELQVDKEFQFVSAKDHKLLQSFNDRRSDLQELLKRRKKLLDTEADVLKLENEVKLKMDVLECGSGDHIMCELFEQAGFDGKPFFGDFNPQPLSSIQPTKGTLRSQLLKFFHCAPKTGLGIEVSFGTAGFGRSLAWAFKIAVTIDFHGLHVKRKPRKETFYTNHFSVTLSQDNFSLNSNMANACLKNELEGRNKDLCFIVVGPVDDQSKLTTVHVLINMLLKSKYLNIIDGAILLCVRPLCIGHKVTEHQYFQYRPSQKMFDTEMKYKGIVVNCEETDSECVFEFYAYKVKANI